MSGLSFGVDVATKIDHGHRNEYGMFFERRRLHPCLCGLMYCLLMFCATGTIAVDSGAACAAGIGRTFNVTSPQVNPKTKRPMVWGSRKYLLERLIT
jgi:hypothetical protein